MGLPGTNWELDFKQCSFRHIMQVLRVCSFSAFSLPPALPPCYCPLAFRRQVRRLTSRISSESYPGAQEDVVSCHGAGGCDSDSYAPLWFGGGVGPCRGVGIGVSPGGRGSCARLLTVRAA